MMWYADHIGEQFEVVREDKDYFWSRDQGGYLNIIKRGDAAESLQTVSMDIELISKEYLIQLINSFKCPDKVRTTYDDDLFSYFKQELIKFIEKQ